MMGCSHLDHHACKQTARCCVLFKNFLRPHSTCRHRNQLRIFMFHCANWMHKIVSKLLVYSWRLTTSLRNWRKCREWQWLSVRMRSGIYKLRLLSYLVDINSTPIYEIVYSAFPSKTFLRATARSGKRVLAIGIMFVRPSVCHVPVPNQDRVK